jgi:hypothetical protein
VKLAVAVLLATLSAGCNRRVPTTSLLADSPDTPDAAETRQLSVRVPAALTLARALDTLTIAVDPASLAATQVEVAPGMGIGVETDVVVFARGGERPARGRHGLSSGADFDVGTDTWTTAHDGIPVPGVKYVAEVELVLFETDVPAGHMWDPHAGKYKALWTRTLRQAEE